MEINNGSVQDDLFDLIDDSALVPTYHKWSLWNADAADATKRYLVCRNAQAYSSTEFERRHGFTIFMIGTVNEPDIYGLRNDTEALVKYFLQDLQKGCIIGVSVTADSSGVFQLSDGRYYYRFDLLVNSATS